MDDSRKETKSILFIGMVCAALSCFLLWGAWGVKKDVERFEDEGVITQATILDKRPSSGSSTYRVEYEYFVDGKRYAPRNYETVYEKDIYDSIGEQADVYYLPDDPSKSNLVGNKQNSFDLLYGAALVFSLGGTLVFGMQIPDRVRPTLLAKFMINARHIFGIGTLIVAPYPFLYLEMIPQTLWSGICFGIPILITILAALVMLVKRLEMGSGFATSIERQYIDISHKQLPCPKGQYGFEQTLMGLGFSQLGETDRAETNPEEVTTNWYFHNRDYTILVEVVHILEMMQFSSWFGAEHRVETSFPIGENFDTPTYRSRFTEESIEAAYQLHLDSCQDFIEAHGQPVAIKSIAEALKWDKLFMKRYFRRKNQRAVTVENLRVIYGIYLILYTVGLMIAFYSVENSVFLTYFVIGMALIYPFNAAPSWLMNYRRYPIQFRLLEKEEAKK